MKKRVNLFGLLAGVFLFAACESNIDSKPVYYTVTFNSNGGTAIETQTVESGEKAIKPSDPALTGYGFDGWYLDDAEYDFSIPVKKNLILSARWTEGEVNYTVHHFLQNIENDDYTEEESQTLSGRTNALTQAATNEYEGFTPKEFEQQNIKADGTTEINIYYDRNLITLIFDKTDSIAQWEEEWSSLAVDGKIVLKGKYGANVNAPDLPLKSGYGTAWNENIQTVFTESKTYTVIYEAGNINYKVEHYLENSDDNNYTLYETVNMTGKTGELTQASAKTYEHFTVRDFEQKTLTADTDNIVKIYYAMERFEVAFNTSGGNSVASQFIKYGNKVNEPETPEYEPHIFDGWFITAEDETKTPFDFNTEITSTLTIHAKWKIVATADTVVSEINKMTENCTLILSGEISNTTLDLIKEALNEKDLLIELDLSKTTGLTEIADSQFNNFKRLSKIVLPEGITSIGNQAFRWSENLTEIILPDSLKTIGVEAFRHCDGLTSLTLPDNVTTIKDNAFGYSENLRTITISKSTNSIGIGAFRGCNSLTSIEVSPGNTKFKSIDGVLYSYDETAIYCYPKAKTGNYYSIKETVTSIMNYAFFSCTALTGISIPDKVTTIEKCAFMNCTNLTAISLSSNLSSIGNSVFENCTSLKSINFNGSVFVWENVSKGSNWAKNVPAKNVQCTDMIWAIN